MYTHWYIISWNYSGRVFRKTFSSRQPVQPNRTIVYLRICTCNLIFLFFNNGRILSFSSRPVPRTPFLSYTYVRGLTLTPLSDPSELVYSQYRVEDTMRTSWGIYNIIYTLLYPTRILLPGTTLSYPRTYRFVCTFLCTYGYRVSPGRSTVRFPSYIWSIIAIWPL